jgi:hypothetical protein
MVRAQKRELILVSSRGFQAARVGQEEPRLADQIERNVGERELFLENRCVSAPLGQALSEDERAIA